MKIINLLIMICISIPILSQSNSDVYLGQWLFQKESAYEGGFHGLGIANDTTIRIKQDLRLKIYSIDSVNWYYSETQVVGYIVNENGDYAGPETGSIIEKGLGKIIKLEEKVMNIQNLNLQEGMGGVGSIFVASNMTLEASTSVFVGGNPVVTMVVSSPTMFYVGWSLVAVSFVLKTFNIDILSFFKS